MKEQSVYRERTNLRLILAAVIIVLVGGGLLFVANLEYFTKYPTTQSVIKDIGSLLVSSIALAALWELAAKRSFVVELMAQAKLAQEVREAGLKSVTLDFQHGIDWLHLLRTATKLDIFFAYGRTWRGTYENELRLLAKQPNNRIRVILPDPDDAQLMAELGRRFEMTHDKIRANVLEAAEDFRRIFVSDVQARAEFSLWYLPESPVFSFYRFDTVVVFSMYKHRKTRGGVPTFLVDKGGTLSEFMTQELYSFIDRDNPSARLIYQKESGLR